MAQEVVLANDATPQKLEASIDSFELALLGFLETQYLPSQDVIADKVTRLKVLSNFEATIDELDVTRRENSVYLSKFVMAVSVGLIDAALNYLWDETIAQLRTKVVNYDLQYFFGQVTQDSKKLKDLKTEDDLAKVSDNDLLIVSKNIGLISELGYKQLDLVREIRNHASAAHPNQNDLRPMQLLSYLETCIAEVIAVAPNEFALVVKRLLASIKEIPLNESDLTFYKENISNLDLNRINSLAQGLFGIATDSENSQMTVSNVLMLWPAVWPRVPEETRNSFGIRLGNFKSGMEHDRAERARELLESVNGLSYIPDSLRAGEIAEAVEALRTAHFGMNNFYNEPAPAKLLLNLVDSAPVPEGVADDYAKVVTKCFLGNGYGVSGAAVEHYQTMISNFSQSQCVTALLHVTDVEVSSALTGGGGAARLEELLDMIEPRIHNETLKQLLEQVRSSSQPAKMHADTSIRKLRLAWQQRSALQ